MSSPKLCDRCWISLGALLAGLAVAAGAFGAHGLDAHFHQKYTGVQYEKKVAIEGTPTVVSTVPLAQKYLADFKTGAEYQMYHGLALLAVGILAGIRPSRALTVAGSCFLIGCLGFSGGLYAYTLTNTRWIGMLVVPIGGTFFLIGWTAFLLAFTTRPASTRVELPSS